MATLKGFLGFVFLVISFFWPYYEGVIFLCFLSFFGANHKSKVLLPESDAKALCMPLLFVKYLVLGCGLLAAIFLLWIFQLLLQSIDMKRTVVWNSCSDRACLKDSCFCDCDLGHIVFARREWKDFGCEIFGLQMNRCWITCLGNLLWLGATSRLGWLTYQDCKGDPGQLFLLIMPCVLSSTFAIPLWNAVLSRSNSARTVAGMYNIINTCLLASSMSIVMRLASMQQKQRCCGRAFDMLARQFLWSFWPTAVFGELCVMLQTKSTALFIEYEQENKFYLLYMVLGLLLSWTAWKLGFTATIYDSTLRVKMKRVLCELVLVKLIWFLSKCCQWYSTCYHCDHSFAKTYHWWMFQVERLALLKILQLMRRFEVHYAQFNELPNRRGIRDLND